MPLSFAFAAADSGLFGVHVAAGAVGAAEHQGAYAQDAAAAAEVEDELLRPRVFLQGLKAHAGRGVAAGAEGEAGVQPEDEPLRSLRDGLPAREDEQPFAYLNGLVILLPALGPVLVRDGAALGLKAGAVREGGELRAALRRVLNVELHSGDAAVARFQLLVHVVPILPVLLQKTAEVRLVLYDETLGAEGGEPFAERVYVLGHCCGRRLLSIAYVSAPKKAPKNGGF